MHILASIMNMFIRVLCTIAIFSYPIAQAISHDAQRIHDLCLDSKDYKGCIHTNSIFSVLPGITTRNKIWRTYGPIKINISQMKTKKSSFIAPALNYDNKPIYIALDCSSKSINVTGPNANWKGWIPPSQDFEFDYLADFCKDS